MTPTSTCLLRGLTAPLCHRRACAASALASVAASARSTGAALLQRNGRVAAVSRRLATHGSALVCSAAADGVVEVQLKVEGMVCDGCSSRVEEALQKMAGVKQVHVDLDKGLAVVHVEAASQMDALAAVQPLAEAIRGLGFEAEPHFGQP